MGKLYCICKEASVESCDTCQKRKDINPTLCVGNDTWPRVLEPAIIHYSGKPRKIGA